MTWFLLEVPANIALWNFVYSLTAYYTYTFDLIAATSS